MKTTTNTAPQIITNAAELLARYDVLFCDVWGVTHDGHRAFESANVALKTFRQNRGTVILVSNAPVPKARVHAMLTRVGVLDEAWDDIVSSGDIALRHVQDRGYNRLHRIGPADRDAALFSKLPGTAHEIDCADAIICTGLNDDRNETAQSYRPTLELALKHKLPFVCANPDLVVHVGGKAYLCAGVIAKLYEDLGGDVYWAGKPHPSAFETARTRAAQLRGEPTIPNDKILAIGDAIRTDIEAARVANVDALFVTSGIHRDDIMVKGSIDPTKLAAMFESPDAPPAIAATAQLSL